jgi:xanthine dehydrogenase small subunit
MIGYHRPASLEEALAIRASTDVAVLAGGTDLYPAYATRRAWGQPAHKPVLDLSRLQHLRGIREEEQHWRFGALTTWTDLIRADLPPLFDGWRQAAREVGGAQIQNRGTLAGNLCTASPAGDGVPCVMALDGMVELASQRGVRHLPVMAFNTGYRQTALERDELVTSLLIPKVSPLAHSCFRKLGARRYLVISIAMAAIVVETTASGDIIRLRVAVGACGEVAQRLDLIEALLAGKPLSKAPGLIGPDHLVQLKPIDDVRSSAEHRRAAALELVRDGLSALATEIAGRTV